MVSVLVISSFVFVVSGTYDDDDDEFIFLTNTGVRLLVAGYSKCCTAVFSTEAMMHLICKILFYKLTLCSTLKYLCGVQTILPVAMP